MRLATWDFAAILGLGLLLAWWALQPGHQPGMAEGNDLVVFYEAASRFAATGNPYGSGFVGTASFALLLTPLTAVGVDAAARVWLALSLVGLVGLSAATLHVAGVPARAWPVCALAAGLLLWPADSYGLVLGQSSTGVAMLATLATAVAQRSPPAAGLLLAFAATTKPHLVLLLAASLAADQFRRTRGLSLASGFVVVSASLLAMAALHSRSWIDVLRENPPESWDYWGSTVGANVFFSALLADRRAGWFLLATLGAALLTGLAIWWWRSEPTSGELASAVMAASLLITPYAYPHDYVVLALPLVWIGPRVWRSSGPLSAPLLVGLGLVAWFAPIPARYDDLRFSALMLPALLLATLWLLPTKGPSSSPARLEPPPQPPQAWGNKGGPSQHSYAHRPR